MQSALAPTSQRMTGFFGDGTSVARAGRETPLIRPMTSVPAARQAPVEPAEKKPCASPSLTSLHPTTIEESFFFRTAFAGCSAIEMTSVVARAVQRSCFSAKGSTISAGPQRITLRSMSCSSACATPSRTTPGALSPPSASTEIVTFCATASLPFP